MTTQVAIMNGYGLAMASDRHVYRGPDTRSTGQDVKLLALRGNTPAAMMAAGPFAVFGLPVSRLALRLEQALAAAAATPDTLAEAALEALRAPLEGAPARDEDLLAEVAEQVLGCAADAGGGPLAGLEQVLAEIAAAPACRDAEAVAARFDGAWERALPELADRPSLQAVLREAPELCGRAVAGALSHDWHHSELFLTVGLCCPASGVPVLLALRLWRGVGGCLHHASRLDQDWEAAWRAGRTVITAQGSGRPRIEAMIDGIASDHWNTLPSGAQDTLRPAMGHRWEDAHGRLAVSSARELAAVAMGLVRGAEVIGYLTHEDEGCIAGVDGVIVTPRGVEPCALDAGPPLRVAA